MFSINQPMEFTCRKWYTIFWLYVFFYLQPLLLFLECVEVSMLVPLRPLAGHTMTSCGQTIFIIGGYSPGYGVQSQVNLLIRDVVH